MHDELLERRLRAALRDEADALPFTITAAELERRLALRGRTAGGRRLGLLLAAAVAIGSLGVAALLGGLANPTPQRSKDPSAPVALTSPDPAATAQGPVALPELEQMIAAAPVGTVVVAQAHGPAESPEIPRADIELDPPVVNLGTLEGSVTYEASIACLSAGPMRFSVARFIDQQNPLDTIACDGRPHAVPIVEADGNNIFLAATDHASWRIVVRRIGGGPPPPLAEPPNLDLGTGLEALLFQEQQTIDPVIERTHAPSVRSTP